VADTEKLTIFVGTRPRRRDLDHNPAAAAAAATTTTTTGTTTCLVFSHP